MDRTAPTYTPAPYREPILGSFFLPGGSGTLDSHVVLYRDPTERARYVVHYLVHPEDRVDGELRQPYLLTGSYGLTDVEALREFERWIRREFGREE